jgi:hypothetical protein
MEEVSADVVKQQGIAIDEDDLSLSPPEVDEPEQPQQYSNNNNSGETITIEEPSYAQKHEVKICKIEKRKKLCNYYLLVIQHALKSNRIVLLLANINNDIVFSFEFLINFFLTVKESAATFEISLSDPEKHGDGMNAYVTYAIKTRVRRHIMLLLGRIDTSV